MTSSHPHTHIRLRDLSELIAGIPCILGFPPTNSLVLFTFRRCPELALSATMRIDLPKVEHVPLVVAEIVPAIAMNDVVAAIAVVVSDTPTLHERLIEALRGSLAEQEILLTHASWTRKIADGEPWRCYDDPQCTGTVPDPQTSALAAAVAVAGDVTYPSREAMVAHLAPGPEDLLAQRKKLLQLLPTEPYGEGELTADLELLGHALDEAARSYDPPTLTDHQLARLAKAMTRTPVKDECLAIVLDAPPESPERLWTVLARSLPEPERAEPALLLAMSAYLRGAGVMAALALKIALAANPVHGMAMVLDHALHMGVPPNHLRIMLMASIARTKEQQPATTPHEDDPPWETTPEPAPTGPPPMAQPAPTKSPEGPADHPHPTDNLYLVLEPLASEEPASRRGGKAINLRPGPGSSQNLQLPGETPRGSSRSAEAQERPLLFDVVRSGGVPIDAETPGRPSSTVSQKDDIDRVRHDEQLAEATKPLPLDLPVPATSAHPQAGDAATGQKPPEPRRAEVDSQPKQCDTGDAPRHTRRLHLVGQPSSPTERTAETSPQRDEQAITVSPRPIERLRLALARRSIKPPQSGHGPISAVVTERRAHATELTDTAEQLAAADGDMSPEQRPRPAHDAQPARLVQAAGTSAQGRYGTAEHPPAANGDNSPDQESPQQVHGAQPASPERHEAASVGAAEQHRTAERLPVASGDSTSEQESITSTRPAPPELHEAGKTSAAEQHGTAERLPDAAGDTTADREVPW